MSKISYFRLLIIILLVNLAGFTLKYFELDTYIILAGFRFHLSFILPLMLLYPKGFLRRAKKELLHPVFKKKFIPFFWVIIPAGIVIVLLYLLKLVELGDPDYFYEFGLSSIFDYPLYLIWNFPQLFFLFLFLAISTDNFKNKFIHVFLILILLFAFELTPVDFEIINYFPFIELILAGIIAALILQFFSNVYWFAAVIFSIFWSSLLAFGSVSRTLINLLYASQYNQWEGFFEPDKGLHIYLLSAQLFILIILLLLSIPFSEKNKISEIQTSEQ